MSNLAQPSLFSLLTSLHKVFAHVFNGFHVVLVLSGPLHRSTNSTVRQGPSSVKRKPLFKTERDVISERET